MNDEIHIPRYLSFEVNPSRRDSSELHIMNCKKCNKKFKCTHFCNLKGLICLCYHCDTAGISWKKQCKKQFQEM